MTEISKREKAMPRLCGAVAGAIVLMVVTAAGIEAQYLGSKTCTCGNCIIPNNSCLTVPPNPKLACSATNYAPEESWPAGSSIHVYINNNSTTGFASATVTSIEEAFNNWSKGVGGAKKSAML
jgi:hypothetical protein